MSVLLLYFGILISYTENLSLEPTKGEKLFLRSTTADGFFLTITLSLRCHMKPQRTWRTSQTRIETSFQVFNILKVKSTWGFTSQRGKVFKYHFTGVGMTSILTGAPKLLDLRVFTWYLYQRYCICPSHHDSAHERSKHLLVISAFRRKVLRVQQRIAIRWFRNRHFSLPLGFYCWRISNEVSC